jgi:drug/metabolite transporter (DMT)-like permease
MTSPVSHLRAICLAIVGFTCWVLCDSALKLAGRSNLPSYEIVAFLGIFMMLFISLYGWWQSEVKSLWPKRPKRLLVRSLLDVGNNLCVVIALRHLPLTLFYILIFASPMVVAVLGRVFLHERLDLRRTAAILVGFLGVVTAVYPSRSGGSGEWFGFAACAVCVSCFSAGIVWSRVIAQAERPESMSFFSGMVSAAVGLAAMLMYAAPVTGRLLVALVFTGLLGAIGNICVFVALKHVTAATVSQYHYTQLVSGAVVAYLLFHEKPTLWMLAGTVLIVAAGLYIALQPSSSAASHSGRRGRTDRCTSTAGMLD